VACAGGWLAGGQRLLLFVVAVSLVRLCSSVPRADDAIPTVAPWHDAILSFSLP